MRRRVAALRQLGARTLIILAAVLAAQAALVDVDAHTTAPATLRARPDLNARAVARLPAGTVVHIRGCDNDWCQVGVNRRTGYVRRDVLALEPDRALAEAVELPAEDPNQVFLEAVVDERPEVVSGPPMLYPPLLRQAGIQGRVLVQAIIDTNGRAEPASIRILQSADPGFDASARDYVRLAHFRPARIKGRGVRVLVNLPIDFKIRRSKP